MKTIYIGSDHAGFDMKTDLKDHLRLKDYPIEDVGNFNSEPVDYPDIAKLVAEKVNENPVDTIGILICGTGIGMAIAANRYKNVRAAPVQLIYMAEMARRHGNCNVITIGSRISTRSEAKMFLDIFLNTPFDGNRHSRRVDKLGNLG